MIGSKEQFLRIAFLAGAITDAGALLPMLSPRLSRIVWGVHDNSANYRFAMEYGASLMVGWTILLLWAFRRPVERRFIAPLTTVVIFGLIFTEAVAVRAGTLAVWRMLPTWCLQAVLIALFASAYHVRRKSCTVRVICDLFHTEIDIGEVARVQMPDRLAPNR
jgi:hypothetical protein